MFLRLMMNITMTAMAIQNGMPKWVGFGID
jgi:hypothetical protein